MNSSNEIIIQNRILYQSNACIVVNKQKGEAAQGVRIAAQGVRIAAQGAKEGIVNLPKELAKMLGVNRDTVQAAHRIDVPVTGCCLFALTKPALAFLYDVFAGKYDTPVEKQYWAIAEKPKNPVLKDGTLTHWIETNQKHNKTFVYNEEGSGRKKAVLHYRITGEGDNYLFLEVKLLSGRHHQIRAQLAAIGLYIKGDVKYGAKRSEKDGGIRLHARSLSFPNPLNPGEKIIVTADPPQMDNLWEAFIHSIDSIE